MDGESVKKEAEQLEVEYELETDAHEKCKNYDVVEAIEENYQGTLNELKIDENDPSRFILVQKLKEELFLKWKELKKKTDDGSREELEQF